MRLKLAGHRQEFEVEIVAREGRALRVRLDGVETMAGMEPLDGGSAILTIDGRRVRVRAARTRGGLMVAVGPRTFEFVAVEGRSGSARHGLAAPELAAPMPGKILKLLVAEGDRVEHGQALAVIEAMKMETTLYAESAAVVKRLGVAVGEMVDHGAVIVEFSEAPADSSASAATVREP